MKAKIKFTLEELNKLKDLCIKAHDFELAAKVREMERQDFKIPKGKSINSIREAPKGQWIDIRTLTDISNTLKILNK